MIHMWLITVIGLSLLIANSTISDLVKIKMVNLIKRKWFNNLVLTLLSCFECISVWVAMLLSLIMYSPTNHYFNIQCYNFLIDGAFAYGVVRLILMVEEKWDLYLQKR